jgi:hypothetical protein
MSDKVEQRTRINIGNELDGTLENLDMEHPIFNVVISDEACLICGRFKRLKRVVRNDGKKEIILECLYCMTDKHTDANKGDGR